MKKAILIAVLAGTVGAAGVIVVQTLIRPAPQGPGPTGPSSPAGAPQTLTGSMPAEGPLPPSATTSSAPAAEAEAEKGRLAAHEQAAVIAVAEIKGLLAAGEYEKASGLARQGIRDYFDTPAAGGLTDLVAAAEKGLADQREEQARRAAELEGATAAERQARHDRFVRLRDQGAEAMDRKDYASAVTAFRAALAEEEDPQARAQLEEALEATLAPRIGVVEFAVTGDVGIAEAGKTVAELVLTHLPTDKYRLVERTQVAALLYEKDLAIAQIVDNPALLRDKNIRGVKYLVVGTVGRLGSLIATARLVNAATGEVVQTADVSADTPAGLQEVLKELVAILQMAPAQKEAYLAQKAFRAESHRAEVAEGERRRDERARRAEEERRQNAMLWQAHVQEAVVVLAQVKALLAQRDFLRARDLAAQAVVDYSDTPYAVELGNLRAAAERELAALAEAQRLERQREGERLRRRQQHVQEAMLALADIKGRLARKDYDKAVDLCQLAGKDYADTPQASEIDKALKQALQGQKDLSSQRPPRPDIAKQRFQEASDLLKQLQALAAAGQYEQVVAMGHKGARDYADTALGARLADAAGDAQKKILDRRAEEARRRQREQDALQTLADLKALLARREFDKAVAAGEPAVQKFADTAAAKDLAAALAEAKKNLNEVRKQKHEQDARAALVSIQRMIADEKFDKAIELATQASRDYADTSSARELADSGKAATLAMQNAQDLLKGIRAAIAKRDYRGALELANRNGGLYRKSPVGPAILAAMKEAETALAAADAGAEAKRKHEADARRELGEIKALMDKKDFEKAVAQATAAAKAYADTAVGKDLGAALAAAQKEADAARRGRDEQGRKLKHEQDANSALVALRGLVAKREYDKALPLAKSAAKDFADTTHAKELTDLQVIVQKALDAARTQQEEAAKKAKHEQDANAAMTAIQDLLNKKEYERALPLLKLAAKDFADTSHGKALSQQVSVVEKAIEGQQRHQRYLALRDAGVKAMNRKDYAAAVAAFQNALKEEDTPETRALLAEAQKALTTPAPQTRPVTPPPTRPVTPATRPITPTTRPVAPPTRPVTPRPTPPPAIPTATRPLIAVAEFQIGNSTDRPGVAAKDIDSALLAKFPKDKYQAVPPKGLSDALAKAGLDAAKVAAQPELLSTKKVQGLDYLVTGIVASGAPRQTTITATLSAVATGKVIQTASVSLGDPKQLDAALTELAKILQMSDEDKKTHLKK